MESCELKLIDSKLTGNYEDDFEVSYHIILLVMLVVNFVCAMKLSSGVVLIVVVVNTHSC